MFYIPNWCPHYGTQLKWHASAVPTPSLPKYWQVVVPYESVPLSLSFLLPFILPMEKKMNKPSEYAVTCNHNMSSVSTIIITGVSTVTMTTWVVSTVTMTTWVVCPLLPWQHEQCVHCYHNQQFTSLACEVNHLPILTSQRASEAAYSQKPLWLKYLTSTMKCQLQSIECQVSYIPRNVIYMSYSRHTWNCVVMKCQM